MLLMCPNAYKSCCPTSHTSCLCHAQKVHRHTDPLTSAAFCALCTLLHLFALFVCSVAPLVWYCSKLIPTWPTFRSVSTSHLTDAHSWHHWIVLHSTCIHMNSAEAWGTFTAHLYGLNGTSTSGTSRTGIISDPCNSLPSATMSSCQKEHNIIKTWIFYCFTR